MCLYFNNSYFYFKGIITHLYHRNSLSQNCSGTNIINKKNREALKWQLKSLVYKNTEYNIVQSFKIIH